MSYLTFAPSSFEELMSTMVNFAIDQGWTGSYVDSGNGRANIVMKSDVRWEFLWSGSAPTQPSSRGFAMTLRTHNVADSSNVDASIVPIGGLGQCFLFGGVSPEPWMHLVMSPVAGDYLHVYMGYLEKFGNYTGGAIWDVTCWASGFSSSSSNDRRNWGNVYNHMLFSQPGGRGSTDQSWAQGRPPGGVLLEHADVSRKWGRFTGDPNRGTPATEYYLSGGATDNHHRALVIPGNTSFSGVQPIAPFVIRAEFDRDDFRVPIGCVPGIRMANIADLDPEQIIDFGGVPYQVFPLGNKYTPLSNPSSNQADWLENWRVGGSSWGGIAIPRVA